MEVSKVFVIIVTYNGKQWYDRCFTSLRSSEYPINVLVIDNSSSDDTISFIKTCYPEIYLIESKINLGFGQGNNIGIRYALENQVDYVFLLNQDAWIEPNTIADLIDIHERNTDFGILSPMHLNAEKTSIEDGLMYYIADYHITNANFINDLYFGRLSEVYETQYINAAAWLLPRRTLDIVGGFDPIFYHYGEDDNYLQRVQYHGFKIGICPKIIICHDTLNREIKKKYINQSSKISLLVKFTDVNKNESLNKYILFNLRKAFKKGFKLEFRKVMLLLHESYYIWKLRKQISQSKIQNCKKTISWL